MYLSVYMYAVAMVPSRRHHNFRTLQCCRQGILSVYWYKTV